MMRTQKEDILPKTLLVLGASYSQIPLFKAAGRLGVHTIAATIPGPYQGIGYADEVVWCDITKPSEVLAAIEGRAIDGVTTCCMDVGTRSMAVVAKERSLPGPGIGGEAAVDKLIQKELFARAGIRTASYIPVRTPGELEEACSRIGFPLMVKAVDLTGSRGVRRVDSPDEARMAYESARSQTKKEYVLVEKFLQGEMFGIEAMVSHGQCVYVLPLGNDLHNGNPPFPQGHHVPWKRAGELSGRICEFAASICRSLEFDDCAVDMDCMLAEDELWVIEATPRAGATAITDTVGIYYGIDYFEAIVKCALGEEVGHLFQRPGGANATWLISAPSDGILGEILLPEELPDYVYDLSFNVKPGDPVRRMRSGADRIGQLIVRGKDAQDCHERISRILSQIKIRVAQDAGISGNSML